MEAEHLEVKILEALRNLGPPQIQELAARADYQAHVFTCGLGVAYAELEKLSWQMKGDRSQREMQLHVTEGQSLVFALHERLNNRPAIMDAMLAPEKYAGREVMLGLLAQEMSLVWKEIIRDRYEVQGKPDKTLEASRLAPELEVLEQAVLESQVQSEEQVQPQAYERSEVETVSTTNGSETI